MGANLGPITKFLWAKVLCLRMKGKKKKRERKTNNNRSGSGSFDFLESWISFVRARVVCL